MASKYKPILFSTEMVQAILEGRKTQTRRIVKPQPTLGNGTWDVRNLDEFFDENGKYCCIPKINTVEVKSVKIKPGDILWVRETWQTTYNESTNNWDSIYKADGGFWIDDDGPMKWKPSIFMPRKYARIFLEVTNVRVERLRDISESDAYKEGFGPVITEEYPAPGKFVNHLNKHHMFTAIDSFASMWVKLNGTGAWKANPWVWVYEFKVVEKPNDFLITNF